MTNKQRTWGQFATPTDVADLLLGFCLRRPDDRLLDPSCGDGALLRRAAQWQAWLASSAGDVVPETLFGVEMDAETADRVALPGIAITRANFFALAPATFPPLDAVIGNPPYTRAEWIGHLNTAAEAQLFLFAPDRPNKPQAKMGPLLPDDLRAALSGRAGLYAYFFIHSLEFLRAGGRLGFIVPNGWLDVAYGRELKQFLLAHFRILAVIESSVERWFGAAGVNTCAIILERQEDPADRDSNRVRFVSLQQPLRELLACEPADPHRVAAVEQLIGRLMPPVDRRSGGMSVRVHEQASLDPSSRWSVHWRAPEVYLRRPDRPLIPLNQWADIRRGYTTGANPFFYLDPAQIEAWGIEPEFRRPLLKSLRNVHRFRLAERDCDHECLAIAPDAVVAGSRTADYLAWGVDRGIHLQRTCAARRPWYALGEQPPATVLLAKGVWQRHFAPLPEDPVAVDQQIYRVTTNPGIDPQVAAALLNSAWFALQCELRGRLNLGEGVLWLATYEVGQVELPDPRMIDPGAAGELAGSFRRLAERPVVETAGDLNSPDRWHLDELVFDLVGLDPVERAAARRALVDCLAGRRQRALTKAVE